MWNSEDVILFQKATGLSSYKGRWFQIKVSPHNKEREYNTYVPVGAGRSILHVSSGTMVHTTCHVQRTHTGRLLTLTTL